MEEMKVEVQMQSHFQLENIGDLVRGKGTVQDPDTGNTTAYTVAICQSEEESQVFALKNIPVVSYEPELVEGLSEPLRSRCQNPPKSRYVVLSLEGVTDAFLYKVWCRYFGLPMDVLETRRTKVREICMEDMEALFLLYEDPSITAYMEPLFDGPQEVQYQRDYIEKVYGLYDYGMWLVVEKSTGQVIGRAGIESKDPAQPYSVEMGYLIRKDKQGMGYATEVCQGIIAYAKEELEMERVVAMVNPANKASVRVAKKLGMRPTGESTEETGEIVFELRL